MTQGGVNCDRARNSFNLKTGGGSVSPADILNAVANAAARTYEWSGSGPVSQYGDDPTELYNKALRRLEIICVHSEELERLDRTLIRKYRTSGLELWVLVPLKAMGEAHRRLKHVADRIQPYWFDSETNIVKFGKEENP